MKVISPKKATGTKGTKAKQAKVEQTKKRKRADMVQAENK
jgi:hypothetical protein